MCLKRIKNLLRCRLRMNRVLLRVNPVLRLWALKKQLFKPPLINQLIQPQVVLRLNATQVVLRLNATQVVLRLNATQVVLYKITLVSVQCLSWFSLLFLGLQLRSPSLYHNLFDRLWNL